MTCGIYEITDKVSGKSYIGQSRDIERRWKKHHKRFPLENCNYQILIECEQIELDFWEIAWIAAKNTLHPNGFNLKTGGQGWDMVYSEETRLKLSAAGKKADHSKNGGGPGSSIGGKSQIKSGVHNMLKKIKCPHCEKVGMSRIMKRWHFDNCKRRIS